MSDELLARLQRLTIDEPGAAMTFHRRLAHENGWSEGFARRVIDEYRRFVWLAVRAGHPVTPSPAVDEAWHLHLCYTRSYWDELCAGVLGRPLHHGPTRGGPHETAKYDAWYERTLASYRTHFGEPPADIWPAAAERSRAVIPRKVDPHAHWIVSKSSVRRTALLAAACLAAAGLAGCTGMIAMTWSETAFLALVGAGMVFGLVLIARHLLGGASGEHRGDNRDKKEKKNKKDGTGKDAGGGTSSSCGGGCGTDPGCGSGCGSGCSGD